MAVPTRARKRSTQELSTRWVVSGLSPRSTTTCSGRRDSGSGTYFRCRRFSYRYYLNTFAFPGSPAPVPVLGCAWGSNFPPTLGPEPRKLYLCSLEFRRGQNQILDCSDGLFLTLSLCCLSCLGLGRLHVAGSGLEQFRRLLVCALCRAVSLRDTARGGVRDRGVTHTMYSIRSSTCCTVRYMIASVAIMAQAQDKTLRQHFRACMVAEQRSTRLRVFPPCSVALPQPWLPLQAATE
jgi:hypothetical protein